MHQARFAYSWILKWTYIIANQTKTFICYSATSGALIYSSCERRDAIKTLRVSGTKSRYFLGMRPICNLSIDGGIGNCCRSAISRRLHHLTYIGRGNVAFEKMFQWSIWCREEYISKSGKAISVPDIFFTPRHSWQLKVKMLGFGVLT